MLEHTCEICGKKWRKKLIADNKVVCNKHYLQFRKFGYFRDNSPRTQRDKNEITIEKDIAYINLYDKFYNVIARAKIDSEDVQKVKNIKWRLNCNGYVINNTHTTEFLHRRILNTDCMVDHINEDRLDNRKCNLRICTKSQNQMNVKSYLGVYQRKDKWFGRIKINGKTIDLGTYPFKEEALYARWYAERLIFKEFACEKEEPYIIKSRKIEIQEFVNKKVQRL